MRSAWGAMLKAERDSVASKKTRTTTSENFKFRGLPKDDNNSPPPMTAAGIPRKSLVRDSWAKKNTHLEFQADEPTMTIFSLAIDPAQFDPRDEAFWANDADDEFEEELATDQDGAGGMGNEEGEGQR